MRAVSLAATGFFLSSPHTGQVRLRGHRRARVRRETPYKEALVPCVIMIIPLAGPECSSGDMASRRLCPVHPHNDRYTSPDYITMTSCNLQLIQIQMLRVGATQSGASGDIGWCLISPGQTSLKGRSGGPTSAPVLQKTLDCIATSSSVSTVKPLEKLFSK